CLSCRHQAQEDNHAARLGISQEESRRKGLRAWQLWQENACGACRIEKATNCEASADSQTWAGKNHTETSANSQTWGDENHAETGGAQARFLIRRRPLPAASCRSCLTAFLAAGRRAGEIPMPSVSTRA